MNQSEKLNRVLRFIEKFLIPQRLFRFFQPVYHYLLALGGAVIYRFPSRKMHVVAVTGTKGKTTTTEFLYAIWRAHGHHAALSNTIRFVVNDTETRNKTKMALPGRFFLQRFLRKAANAGCSHVVVEVSSEAARQFRHRFIAWDGLIFTNLTPEHIESHGSFEKYKQAKLAIARTVTRSSKRPTRLVASKNDSATNDFAALPFSETHLFAPPEQSDEKQTFIFEETPIKLQPLGDFNKENAYAAAVYARALDIPNEAIKKGVESVSHIRGRMEFIESGQPFSVVVDYAHTKESLEKVYQSFENKRRICVLGNTGGGRDTWKRPTMAEVADTYCDYIVLTDEDPYDEDPEQIVSEMKAAIKHTETQIVMDRRAAISHALKQAQENDVVIITGKGTDPYIMRANNKKEPWDDATVVREELSKLLTTHPDASIRG